MGTLHSRITAIKPTCQRCNKENEYLNHMLFFCDSSRAVWFASPLALRVDGLPLNFTQSLLNLTTTIQSQNHQLLFNIMWSIWKARNEHTFEGRTINPVKVLQLAERMTHIKQGNSRQTPRGGAPAKYPVWKYEAVMLLDASWQISGKAGVAALLYGAQQGLIWIMAKPMIAHDPFQAEAIAVHETTALIKEHEEQWGIEQFNIFSDCRVLIETLKNGNITDLPSWRAAQQIEGSRENIQQTRAKIRLHHAKRDALQQPHCLANWARRTEGTVQGALTQAFAAEQSLSNRIDEAKFKWEDIEPD
jgi:hypothetical protein